MQGYRRSPLSGKWRHKGTHNWQVFSGEGQTQKWSIGKQETIVEWQKNWGMVSQTANKQYTCLKETHQKNKSGQVKCIACYYFMLIVLNIKFYFKYFITEHDPRKWDQGQINQTGNTCTPYNQSIYQIYFSDLMYTVSKKQTNKKGSFLCSSAEFLFRFINKKKHAVVLHMLYWS